MSVLDAYLGAAAQAVALLGNPEVGASWQQPSALAEMSVGGLAGHLAFQIFSVSAALEEPRSTVATVPLLEHYARVAWINAPLDAEINVGIRAGGEAAASEGARSLLERVRGAFAAPRASLAEHGGDEAVFLPWTGWALSLNDFLITRTMELTVHMDDLAVSVGLATPELPDAVFDPVLMLLARLAVRRHGQAAMLRALARAERAPTAINAI
jgi:hypothetical protein